MPAAAENALDKIRDLYWARATTTSAPTTSSCRTARPARWTCPSRSTRGVRASSPASRSAATTGSATISCRNRFNWSTAQPLDLSALAQSRRNLYDTGAFSVVDITRRAMSAGERKHRRMRNGHAAEQKPVEIDVQVREVQPIPDPLRRVVRHRARRRRHLRHLEPQLARRGARDRPAVALRQAASRRAPLHQSAGADLPAEDDRHRSTSARSSIRRRS